MIARLMNCRWAGERRATHRLALGGGFWVGGDVLLVAEGVRSMGGFGRRIARLRMMMDGEERLLPIEPRQEYHCDDVVIRPMAVMEEHGQAVGVLVDVVQTDAEDIEYGAA